MATAFVTHPACEAHLSKWKHPECPGRLSAIRDELVGRGIFDFLSEVDAPSASRAQLERVHSAEHVSRLFSTSPDSGSVVIDEETVMDRFTLDAAVRGCGGVIKAVELVLGGEVGNAFCCVRPPGHHATRDEAMGFCFFNNVAVGVAHALEVFGMKRIAILDFDAHHGNGTEDIFRDDERVLLCSTFQRGIYLEAEDEGVPGRAVNVALEPGSGGDAFREAVSGRWLPALDTFEPEMVFVSAGFDAHVSDPLSELSLGDDDFRWISEWVLDVAARHAGGRIVSVLEGGYDLGSLGRCCALHVKALLGL